MIDDETVMLYLALVLSAGGFVVCGVSALTLLYLHVWLGALVWAAASACFGMSFYYGFKSFSL